ncbi:hypothetical protein VW35_01150 [Devosia soli]|uniref:Autotransporter domain-containing protein n=1 Tax=Devosia soli TaxID=361041 RepID=A0A0F5LF61_9HYPH|nr:autotransporter domain-containing protein [Devosia soli]KKB80839.1 hypothetical protein VW35_01150 [Devosia soli]
MAQRPFGQLYSTLHQRRRRTKTWLLLGASAAVLAMVLPARAQVDTVTYTDGETRSTSIVMTRQTVGTVATDEFATQSGAISGAYKFSKAGYGILRLSGSNSFSGGLDVNMGTIALANANAAGTGPISMLDGTRLRFDIDNFVLANQVNITGAAEFGGNQRVRHTGLLSGDGRLVVNASLTLEGDNTYSGGTDLVSGSLTPLHENALGAGAVTMSSYTYFNSPLGRALALENDFVLFGSSGNQYFQIYNDLTLNGLISGAGEIIKTGAGTLTLTNANTFAGGIALQNGVIVALDNAALGFGDVYFQGGTLRLGDGVTLANTLQTGSGSSSVVDVAGGSATLSGNIAGSSFGGGYTKTGAGELIVSGYAGYGGNTNIVGGTLTADMENALAQNSLHILNANTRLNIFADQQIAGLSANSTSTTALNDYTLTLNPQATTSTFQGQLTGSADSGIVMIGSRLLTLDGDNEGYGGTLRIESGPVRVANDFGSMRTILNGGTLAGDGRLGDVTVNGGTLAGYDGTRLTMSNLVLGADARILAEFGALSTDELFYVRDDLTLDGTLDIVDVGGFDPGIYRLFSYGGTLIDNGLDIGSLPAGFGPGDLDIQTSVAGQVNVTRHVAAAGDTLFWDGSDAALWENGTIDGGNGVWGATTESFTSADGLTNGPQSPTPGFVVFTGNAGEVEVDGTVAVTGMQFATSGYDIHGGRIELVDGDRIVRVGDGTAAGEDHVAFIDSNLTGSGRLVKTDRGMLVLNSHGNSHGGGTEVRGGTLEVNGIIGSVTVSEDGRLQGSGAIGNADVAGTIAAGSAFPLPETRAASSFGRLSIAGDLYMLDTATMEIKVDDQGNSDLFEVDGTAHLGGEVVALASGGDYSAGVEYTFLRAEGGVDGQFDGVSANLAFLEASLAYNANDVRLLLTRNQVQFADIASTANQRASAGALDTLGPGNLLYDRVLTLGADDARASFDQLSGEVYASTQSALLAAGQDVGAAMEDRVAAAFPQLGAAKTNDKAVGINLWSRASGHLGVLDANGNAARTGFSAGNLFVGADATFNQDWMLGAMLGFGQSGVNVGDRGSTATANNYHAGIYGGGEIDNLTLKFGAAYSQHEIKTNRTVSIPGFTDALFSSRLGGTGQVFGEIGYKFEFDSGLIVEPFVNLAHASLYTGGFAEQGGPAALSGGSAYASTTHLTLGLRGETSFAIGEMQATAHGMIGWRHELGGVDPNSTHAFGTGSSFTVAGSSPASDAAVIEAGLDFNISPNVDLGFSYGGHLSPSLQQHGVKANLAVQF